jgi:two-component system NtrC family sensor kinase
MAEERLDFLTLEGRKGGIIFRFHNPKVLGDSLIHDPFVKAALEKKAISGTQILSGEDLLKEGETLAQRATLRLISTLKAKPAKKVEETSGMVLKSAYLIIEFNGEVLGVLTGGVLLNRNYEIVDRIKNLEFD